VIHLNFQKSFRLKRGEEAVSPVVGVMLMLVVTIIIAAVVSAFAGGLSGSQTKTPQASFLIKTGWDVKDDGSIDTSAYDFAIEHMGGDAVPTKDTQLITYLTLPNGTVVRHVQTATSPYDCATNSWGVTSCSLVPHVYDNQKYGFPCGDATTGYRSGAWFGNATWMPGDVARTYQLAYTAELFGLVSNTTYPNTAPSDLTAATDLLKQCISNHSQLEVKLLHVPSGKYIIDQKVTLQ
jgi:archaeal type IV pilus assembly protein PilA